MAFHLLTRYGQREARRSGATVVLDRGRRAWLRSKRRKQVRQSVWQLVFGIRDACVSRFTPKSDRSGGMSLGITLLSSTALSVFRAFG